MKERIARRRGPRHTRHRGAKLTLAASAATLAVASCAPASAGTDDIEVVASFYPLQFVAQEVGGSEISVTNLTPSGAEPHDLELTTRNVLTLEEADVVMTLSGFQPALDDALSEIEGPVVLDSASAENPNLHSSHGHAAHDHSEHDHGSTHTENTGHEGHSHAGVDPHFWLDPTRLIPLARHTAQTFAEADPAHAEQYSARAENLIQRLKTLDEEFTSSLSDCRQDVIVVSHEAFGYLAHRYGLEQVGIAGLDPENEPSPARMQQVARVVQAEGVSTIFTETLVSGDVARAMATELGITVEQLNPLESLQDPQADYFSVMRQNLTSLHDALDCA